MRKDELEKYDQNALLASVIKRMKSVLDELAHDAKGEEAAAINNQGREVQAEDGD